MRNAENSLGFEPASAVVVAAAVVVRAAVLERVVVDAASPEPPQPATRTRARSGSAAATAPTLHGKAGFGSTRAAKSSARQTLRSRGQVARVRPGAPAAP